VHEALCTGGGRRRGSARGGVKEDGRQADEKGDVDATIFIWLPDLVSAAIRTALIEQRRLSGLLS